MEHNQLYTKISILPTGLKSEVNDFVDFLLNKHSKRIKKKTQNLVVPKGRFIYHLILMSHLRILKIICNGFAS
jgi:hypothetical protein